VATQPITTSREPTDWLGWRLRVAEEVLFNSETLYGIWALHLGRFCAALRGVRTAWLRLLALDTGRALPDAPDTSAVWADADTAIQEMIYRGRPSATEAARVTQRVQAAAQQSRRGARGYGAETGARAQASWGVARVELVNAIEAAVRHLHQQPDPQPQHAAAALVWRSHGARVRQAISQAQTGTLTREEGASVRASALTWVWMMGGSVDPTQRIAVDGMEATVASVRILSNTKTASGYVVRIDRPTAAIGMRETDVVEVGGRDVAVQLPAADSFTLPVATGGRATVRPVEWRAYHDAQAHVPDVTELRTAPDDADPPADSLRRAAAALTLLGGGPVSDAARMQIRTAVPAWDAPASGKIDVIATTHTTLRRTWSAGIARATDLHRRLLAAGYDRAALLWLQGDIDGMMAIEDAAGASLQGALGRASSQLQRMPRTR
jgi:hypothetical protein